MKSFLSYLVIAFISAFGMVLLFMLITLPTNPTPCFGTAKDGRLRWHATTDCAHP